ncbi:MAG: hypothetical protein WC863_02285 [Patescibacteria group bacterium]
MVKINIEKITRALLVFLALELLSFLSLAWPIVGQFSFLILITAALAITIYKLEYGLLVVLAELFIGSMGHLFKLDILGQSISIRVALWLIIMGVFIINLVSQLIRDGKKSIYYQSLNRLRTNKFFLALAVIIILGIINGLANHHTGRLIFLDFNSWLYFLLLGPALVIYSETATQKIYNLVNLFIAGSLWLSLKTLFLLFIFTHNIEAAPEIYFWLRQTLVGEMTPTKSGWPRVFIQGQVFPLMAFFFSFWLSCGTDFFNKITIKYKIWSLILAATFFSAVLVSFSRSFWVGLIITLLGLLILIWRTKGFKYFLKSLTWIIISGLFSFGLIYLVVSFPYIHSNDNNLGSAFLERVSNSNEAALSSRWSLLPILSKEVLKEPILGQGFGATVSYISSDPRILQQDPKGRYTTYAFEWGYLDLALKLGLLGLLIYLSLLGKLIFDSLRRGWKLSDDYLFIPLAASLLFLALVHIFTPYLNHPLGIGWIVISSCLIWQSRVY